MGRTILRSANTSEVTDISESFANFTTFNGINDSNNFVSVDQNSFEDANNVYVDNHDELSTRPPMLQGITNLMSVEYIGNTIVYKTYSESDGTYQYELFYNDTSYFFNAVKNDKFCYIDGYYVIISSDDIKVYKWNNDNNTFSETDINPLYVPITTIVEGATSTNNEGYNLINNSYIVRYVMNTLFTTDTTNIEGQTVTITINDEEYEVTWYSSYTTTALEKLSNLQQNISKYDKYMVSNGGTIVFYNYTNNAFYYSLDGKSFVIVYAPTSIDATKLGCCLSDDGTTLYCTYSFDTNVITDNTNGKYSKFNSTMYYITLPLDELSSALTWSTFTYCIYTTINVEYASNYINDISVTRTGYDDDGLPQSITQFNYPIIGDFKTSYSCFDTIRSTINLFYTAPIMHSPNAGDVVVMARIPCLNYLYINNLTTNPFSYAIMKGYLHIVCHENSDGYIESYPTLSNTIQDTYSTLYENEFNHNTEYDTYHVIGISGDIDDNPELDVPSLLENELKRVTLNNNSKIRLINNGTYFVTVLYRYGTYHSSYRYENDGTIIYNLYRTDVSYSVTLINTLSITENTAFNGNTYGYAFIATPTPNTQSSINYTYIAHTIFNALFSSPKYSNLCSNDITIYSYKFYDEYAIVQDNTLFIKLGILAGGSSNSLTPLYPYIINITLENVFTERFNDAINICSRTWNIVDYIVSYIILNSESGEDSNTYVEFTPVDNIDEDDYSYRYPLGYAENATIEVIELDNDSAGLVKGIAVTKNISTNIALTNNYLYAYSTDVISSYIVWQRTNTSDTYVTDIPLYVDDDCNILYLKADTYFYNGYKGFSVYTNNWTNDWYVDITYNDYDSYSIYSKIKYVVNLNISGATSTITLGNSLYQTEFRDDKLYINIDTKVDINDTITALIVFNQTTLGVFTTNTAYEYTYDTDNAAWYLYPTKLQLGVNIGYNIIVGYDATTLYTCNDLGLCALTYENFVQSDEHIYTRLSDNIYNKYYRDYSTNPIKVEKYLHWIILYNNTNIVWLYDTDATAWWKWTLPFTVDLIWTRQQVLYFATYDSDTSLYTAYIVDFDSDNFYDYGTEVIDWNFKSQKLHFGYPNNYKHIRRVSIVTTQNTENVRYKLKFTNYKSWEQLQDKYVVEYDIDNLNTLIQKVNFMKCNAFQFEVSNDTTWKYPQKFVVSNIAIKYRVTEDIR